jgi:hypothetical protein
VIVVRVVLGIAGAVTVLGIFSSVLRTLVIPRPTRSSFTRTVQRLVHFPFQLAADRLRSAEAKDRVLAPVAPLAILITLGRVSSRDQSAGFASAAGPELVNRLV